MSLIIKDGIPYEEINTLQEIAEEVIQTITESTDEELIKLNLEEIIPQKKMIDKIRIIINKELFQHPKDTTELSKSIKELLSQTIFRYYEIYFENKTEYIWSYTRTSVLNKEKEGHYFQGIIREKDIRAAQKKVIKITDTENWEKPWELNPINPTMGYIRRKKHFGTPKMYMFYEHITLKESNNNE